MRTFSITILFIFIATVAEAQTEADAFDKFSNEICVPDGFNLDKTRSILQSRKAALINQEKTSKSQQAVYKLEYGSKTNGVSIGWFNSDGKIFELCSVLGKYDVSFDNLLRRNSNNAIFRHLNGYNTEFKTYVHFGNLPNNRVLVKTFSSKGTDGLREMLITFQSAPGELAQDYGLPGAVPAPGQQPTKGSGSLLNQERQRNASTMAMKCEMDGKVVELQISQGRGTLGPFPVDDLEIDGREVAFKFQGVVHYFDFAKKVGRRSFMGVTQNMECF